MCDWTQKTVFMQDHKKYTTNTVSPAHVIHLYTLSDTIPVEWRQDACCETPPPPASEWMSSCPYTSLILMSCLPWNSGRPTEVTCTGTGDEKEADEEQFLSVSPYCWCVLASLCWGHPESSSPDVSQPYHGCCTLMFKAPVLRGHCFTLGLHLIVIRDEKSLISYSSQDKHHVNEGVGRRCCICFIIQDKDPGPSHVLPQTQQRFLQTDFNFCLRVKVLWCLFS